MGCHGSDCSDPVRILRFFCPWKQSWNEDNYIFFISMVILFIIRSLKQFKKSAFCDCSACTDCRKVSSVDRMLTCRVVGMHVWFLWPNQNSWFQTLWKRVHKRPVSCKLLDFSSSLDYQTALALSRANEKKLQKISYDSSLEVKVILFLSSQ